MDTRIPISQIARVLLDKLIARTTVSVDTTPFGASGVAHLSITEESIDTAIKDITKLLPGAVHKDYTIKLHIENEGVLTYEPRYTKTKVGHSPYDCEVSITYKRKKD